MSSASPFSNLEYVGSVVHTNHQHMTLLFFVEVMPMILKKTGTKMLCTFSLGKERNALETVAMPVSQTKLCFRKTSILAISRHFWRQLRTAKRHFTGG